MLPLDNVTTIYLTGFIAIAFAATQLILFRKKGFSAYLWAAGYLLLGFGYIVTLLNTADPLPSSWVVGPIAVLLGSLVILSSLGIWSGYKLPKKASLICLGGVAVTATLFHFMCSILTKNFGDKTQQRIAENTSNTSRVSKLKLM